MLKRLLAHRNLITVSLLFTLSFLVSEDAFAQGTVFTYQGRLTDGSNPADGLYDMQFKLFDKSAIGTGIQEGPTITNSSLQVANGVFTVQLDFGPVFDGAERFLEISVRPTGSPAPYTALSPRQPLTPTPYAVRSAVAATAETATNAILLGGSPASGFIRNGTSQQGTTNFNISGNGSLGGTLAAGVVNATSQYNIAGNRVLSIEGFNNVFAGIGAGVANTTGGANSFFGTGAGQANTTGVANSFFGQNAGAFNSTGGSNSFFGREAGIFNSTGEANSFFGVGAGFSNTTGNNNSAFGVNAGVSNLTGEENTSIGHNAGQSNTGNNNTFIGSNSDGTPGITNATAIGAGAIVSTSNTVVLGRDLDTVEVPGNLNVTGSISKGGGSFKIDHPLDPKNKTLSHSFVESPDMMNIYNGNAVLDQSGEALVTLPDYFEALNRDFRYQLTAIGAPGPDLYISSEIKGSQFKIAGGTPGLKVSWQVTGVRQDAYANAHRIPVEEEKTERERGTYLHPDAFEKVRNTRDSRRAKPAPLRF